MDHHDEYHDFDFNDHDPYYDYITESDGEDIPDEIQAMIEIEADFRDCR